MDLKEIKSKCRIVNGRKFFKRQAFSHIVWNIYNPNDQIKLKDGYVIHHKDEDILNDVIENLEKMTRGEHNTIHHKGKLYSEKTKLKMSIAGKTKIFTEEHRRKLSIGSVGKKHFEVTKLKMSIARKNY